MIGPNGTGKWVVAAMSSHLVFFLNKMEHSTVMCNASPIMCNFFFYIILQQIKIHPLKKMDKTVELQGDFLDWSPPKFSKFESLYNLWHLEKFPTS